MQLDAWPEDMVRPRYQSAISGKLLGFILGGAFLASALALPAAAHLPRWVEFELVLAVWWVVWWIVLAYVIFNQHEVETDLETPKPNWIKAMPWDGADGCLLGADLMPGCASFFGGLVLILLVVTAVLFVIELLIPTLFLVLVFSVRGMLKQAVSRHPGCEGRFLSSVLWGAFWAALYTEPIAGSVALVQRLIENR